MEKEIWKAIPGYEGNYEVSSFGGVKSLVRKGRPNEKTLKPSLDGKGYLKVNLFKSKRGKTHKIHVLVAMAFLNHTPCGMTLVVDHKDENRGNNNRGNLQLITSGLNVSKSYRMKKLRFQKTLNLIIECL